MSQRAHSVHDALLYVAKVWLAGLAAAILDALGRDDRLVPRVLSASARLEAALDVHGSLTHIEVTDEAA